MSYQNEQLAGLGIRLLALCYDFLVLIALYLISFMVIMVPFEIELLPQWANWLLLLSITFGFYSYFWLRGGQTIGMRAWRLQLRTASDQPLTLKHCLLRFLAGMLNLAILGIGYLYALIQSQKLSLLDIVSDTYVVRLDTNPNSR